MNDLISSSYRKVNGKIIDLDVAFTILGLPNYTLKSYSGNTYTVYADTYATNYYIAGAKCTLVKRYKESSSGSFQTITWATLQPGGYCSLKFSVMGSDCIMLWKYKNPEATEVETSQTFSNFSSAYQYATLQMTDLPTNGCYIYTI